MRVRVSRLGLASPRSILLTCAGDSSHWRANARSEIPRDSRRRRMMPPTVRARLVSRAPPAPFAADASWVRRSEVGPAGAVTLAVAGLTQSRAVATSSAGSRPRMSATICWASASLSALTLTKSASPTSTGR